MGRSSSRCRLRQGTESENTGYDRTWVSHNFVAEEQPSPCAQRRSSKCRTRQSAVERQNYEAAETTDSDGWRSIPCQVGKSRCRVRVTTVPVVEEVPSTDLQESESRQYHQVEEQREESEQYRGNRRPSGLACLVLGDRAQGQNSGCQVTTNIAENTTPHETHNRQYYVDELGRETETQTMSRAVPCQGRQNGQCRVVQTTTTTTENNTPTGSRTREYYINERGEVTEIHSESEYSENAEPAPTPAPTRPPTPAPTRPPTPAPTRPPTQAPTRPPTRVPNPTYRDDYGQASRRVVTTTTQEVVPTESSSRQYYVNEREEVTETETNSRQSGQSGVTPCRAAGSRNDQGQASRCRVTTTTTQTEEAIPQGSRGRQYHINERGEVVESETSSTTTTNARRTNPCQISQPARCQFSQGNQQVTEQRETSRSEARPCTGSGACLVEKLQARLDERRREAARVTIPTTTTTTTPRPRRTTTVAAAVANANNGFEERVVHRESAEHHEETYTIGGSRHTKSLGSGTT